MEILFLALDVDLSSNTGDSVHVKSLVRSLVGLGHSLHVVACGVPLQGQLAGAGFSKIPRGGDPYAVCFLRQLARNIKADIIYERRASPKMAAAVSRLSRIPYVVEFNGIPEEEAVMLGKPPRTGAVEELKKAIRRRIIRKANAIVAVTPGLRDHVLREYQANEDRVFVVPNGVDPQLFKPPAEAEADKKEESSAFPVACFVGNLVAWQGLHCFLDALRLTSIPIFAVIVGDGPERDRLTGLVMMAGLQTHVKFVGQVPHDDVPKYINASSVCVAPFTYARNISTGVSALKVLEYVACGRPVVVSRIPGASDLVERLGCGIVVPPDDAAAMASALERVVSDSHFAQAALAASSVVRETFSWDRTAMKVANILEHVQRSSASADI